MDWITSSQAADEAGVTTRWIIELINAKDTPFPGARKANPNSANSVWLIPQREWNAYMKKRAQLSVNDN